MLVRAREWRGVHGGEGGKGPDEVDTQRASGKAPRTSDG